MCKREILRPRATPRKASSRIETFTIVYVTPDGFLPPLALALIRDRNGVLLMAQGEDATQLKIGREVYLRRIDAFYRKESDSKGTGGFHQTVSAQANDAGAAG